MNVNGVSGYSQLDAYGAYQKAPKASETASEVTKAAEESGVVYEPSAAAQKYTQNTELVQKLLSETDAAKNKLMSYVNESLLGQVKASGNADNIWKMFADGKVTVDDAAKEEAQKAISEGGFWSVEKTSDRIIDMAKALTGGDPSKIQSMVDAFKKGYEQATKAWGKELPEISSKTYDAVMEKFDNWANEATTI